MNFLEFFCVKNVQLLIHHFPWIADPINTTCSAILACAAQSVVLQRRWRERNIVVPLGIFLTQITSNSHVERSDLSPEGKHLRFARDPSLRSG